MPRTEFEIISRPASTQSHLFDELLGQDEGAAGAQGNGDSFDDKSNTPVVVKGQLNGRVPVSSGSLGLVQGVDSTVGAGVRMTLFRGLKELGLGFVERLYDNAGGNFELPQGTALALSYKEKKYDAGCKYIKEDEVRRACDEAYRRDGREIIWMETEGISEIGNGAEATLPIGSLADATANFKLSGLIKYRRLEPFESASGTLLKGQAFATTVAVPITATLARQMPPGAEFEFSGEGHFQFNPELARPVGLSHTLGSVGASARLGVGSKYVGETTISVQRLPGGDMVLMKIATGKSAHQNLGAALKAGMDVKTREYEKMPELGRGMLKYLLERLGFPDLPQFVKRFLQSQLQVGVRDEKRQTEIGRYVFDLSKPAARRAYETVFTKLSLGQTQALVAANDPGVRSQHVAEKASIREKGGAAIMGQTKLYLSSALSAEREGRISADGRKDLLFRDVKFEKVLGNWFSGEQRVKWESVAVISPETQQKQRYYHLAYSNNDRITKEQEVDAFIEFARALGIPERQREQNGEIDPFAAAKVLANRDDTETRISLYFSDQGIARIVKATPLQALEAFRLVTTDPPPVNAATQQIAERICAIAKMPFYRRVFYWRELSRLKKDYVRLLPERSLEKDLRSYAEATQFVELLGAPSEDPEKKAETLFLRIGKASGFELMRKSAALARLAGIDETLLHELSIAGGGLTLGAVNEGEILHPERAMNRILTKIA